MGSLILAIVLCGGMVLFIVFCIRNSIELQKIKKQGKQKAKDYLPHLPNETATEDLADSYIYGEKGNVIRRTDNKPLSDADVAHLIRTGLEQAIYEDATSPNPKFHRTAQEQELSFQFFNNHGEKSDRVCSVFISLDRQAYHEYDADRKIELLELSLEAFEKAKQWHYNYSKGAMFWFQDMYEYMHNSQWPCYSWDKPVKDELEWQRKKKNIIIPRIIELSESGFLQTELYKEFPDIEKTILRGLITELESNDIVRKEKRGNTYFIEVYK